jgi:hypothetical protein
LLFPLGDPRMDQHQHREDPEEPQAQRQGPRRLAKDMRPDGGGPQQERAHPPQRELTGAPLLGGEGLFLLL